MNKNIFEIVSETLLKNEKYISENGELLKAKVYSDIMTMDKNLIALLLRTQEIKQTFFIDIEGTLVFDKQKFAWLIDSKEFLPDSFTKYANKIGITTEGELISKKKDVVLDFPYKDCILEGGQDKENQKRKEIFYHELIAQDEIRRMLDPKVFTNAKRYKKDVIEEDIEFKEEDNLIIKGNNLIALSTLLERYEGAVSSIILDPPYYFNVKKSADTFNYNSNFKLSTWLTFMKNRITLAKDLLSDDGFLVMIIGIDGYPHLKLLMDEIFDVRNDHKRYVGTITWRKSDNQSNIGDFANVIDYIMIYRKNSSTKLNNLPLTEKAIKEYSYEDNIGRYRRSNILDQTRGRHIYNIVTPEKTKLKGPWMITQDEYKKLLSENKIHWPSKGMQIPYGKTYLKDSIEKGQITSDFWDASYGTNQRSADEIKLLFDNRVFEYSKPEKLIMNLISLTSKKSDVILDCFMGSGTTTAVAHKMGRKYIGIEQMDYIEDIAVERMIKVIQNEQGGISTEVDWKGGGSFVYCELKEDSYRIINEIEKTTEENILKVKDKIYSDERIVPYITKEELESLDNDFEGLSLEEKKKALYLIVDKNKLYINYSEIEDENFELTDDEISFTKSFYEGDLNDR